MSKTLSTAEINHLRRLVAWIDCEIGQSPEEMIETAKAIAPGVGEVSNEGKQRLQASLEKSANVPKYVRQAIKVLRKAVEQTPGEIVDADRVSKNELPAPMSGVRD
jgi:hypothetical protein